MYRIFRIIIPFTISWIFLCQFMFYMIQKTYGEKQSQTFQSQLRQELDFSNFHYLSRSITDLSNSDTIKCATVERIKPDRLSIIDLKYMYWDCETSPFLLMGAPVSAELTSLNGDVYRFSFKTVNPGLFYVALWTMRLIGLLVFLLFGILINLRQRQMEIIHQNEKDTAAKISSAAAQVSHDIRSPLMALNVAISQSKGMDPRSRELIRNAANRINDIAYNLLVSSKNMAHAGSSKLHEPTVEMIPAIIEELLAEKRMELREHAGLRIESDIVHAYGAFAKIVSSDFKRMISNLINNSVDAIRNQSGNHSEICGLIQLSVKTDPHGVVVFIRDTGPGIPESLLSKLGMIQVSDGKEKSEASGLGIGTFQASQKLSEWGGRIHFSNEKVEGEGTNETNLKGAVIQINLPLSSKPEWFLPSLSLSENSRVVLFDDDFSVHTMWKEKLRNTEIPGISHVLEFKSITNGKAFERFILNEFEDNDTIISDFEFADDSLSGLDYIKKFEVDPSRVVLVTSHYENRRIQNLASAMGIKIVPKTTLHLLPFSYISPVAPLYSIANSTPRSTSKPNTLENDQHLTLPENCFHGILIDDADEIHMVWRAHSSNRKIKYFRSPQDFLDECELIDQNSPIFLDLHFGKNVKGIDYIEKIYDKNFKNINIVTSFSKSHVEIPEPIRSKVREVRGKIPPWATNTGLEQYDL